MATPIFPPPVQDEAAAFEYVESRLWPEGPVCPHCGKADAKRIRLRRENYPPRPLQVLRLQEARSPCAMGPSLNRPLPLHLWLQVIHLMCASKKGISTRQIQRMLDCSMKTAWFLTHRIREAMRAGELSPMGGAGGDSRDRRDLHWNQGGETPRGGRGAYHKNAVLTLVERGGVARSFHVETVNKSDVLPIVRENIDRETHVMTDEAGRYAKLGNEFAKHDAVDHSRGEYGYKDRKTGVSITTNTVEGYYSIFKRGMVGVYQHCGEQHLHRYLAEFDFRYSNRVKLGVDDISRAERALLGVKGKRLTYETATARKEPQP